MKLVLFCSGGFSTSLLVKKIETAAIEKGIEISVSAHSVNEVEKYSKDADVVLIGPQIRFKLNAIKEQLSPIPVDIIDMKDYAMANGEAVLNKAIELNK